MVDCTGEVETSGLVPWSFHFQMWGIISLLHDSTAGLSPYRSHHSTEGQLRTACKRKQRRPPRWLFYRHLSHSSRVVQMHAARSIPAESVASHISTCSHPSYAPAIRSREVWKRRTDLLQLRVIADMAGREWPCIECLPIYAGSVSILSSCDIAIWLT